jgi:hypothetical protein
MSNRLGEKKKQKTIELGEQTKDASIFWVVVVVLLSKSLKENLYPPPLR